MATDKQSIDPWDVVELLADGLRRMAMRIHTTEGQQAVLAVAAALDALIDEQPPSAPKPEGKK